MENKAEISALVDRLLRHLGPYIRDSESYGRLRADFLDFIEASQWLVCTLQGINEDNLTQSEIEDFLISLDVKLISHVRFHLNSLQEELNGMLEKFPVEGDCLDLKS